MAAFQIVNSQGSIHIAMATAPYFDFLDYDKECRKVEQTGYAKIAEGTDPEYTRRYAFYIKYDE